jgi:arylsulfatase
MDDKQNPKVWGLSPTNCNEHTLRLARIAAAMLLAAAATVPAAAADKKPNILVIFGDDMGIVNVSASTHGLMGRRTPHIDRLAKEVVMFTDYYQKSTQDK